MYWTRRQALGHLFGCAAGVAALRSAGQTPRRPNIVILLSDDQGFADVSQNLLHKKEVATPNIDALMQAGVAFGQAYTSGATCAPTRAGIMTGRYQQRSGFYTTSSSREGLPLTEKIFPQYLKEHGYVCGCFGKWHLGITPEYNPIRRGFDVFYGFLGHGAHDYFHLKREGTAEHNVLRRGLDPIDDEGYLPHRIADETISFIRQHRDRPFFAYVCFNSVHSPAQAPEEDVKQYNTGDETRNILMAMLKHLDVSVGRIVAALKETGAWDNTLLFFLTDNGGAGAMKADNSPLRGFKASMWEGGIRTPFCMVWPGRLPAGSTCNAPVMSFDILPTALAACEVPTPAGVFDGKNLLPAARGEVGKVHDYLCWHDGAGRWAIRKDDWKYVFQEGREELFNLKEDPSESKDLSKTHPDKMVELKQTFAAWLAQMGQPIRGSKEWAAESSRKAKRKKRTDEDDQ